VNIIIERGYTLGIAVLLILAILSDESLADNLSLNGDIVYTGNETKSAGKSTTSSSLSQIYSLNFDKGFTRTIKLAGDIRVSKNRINTSESSSIDPSLFLDMNNDYFNSNLGYQVNDRFLSTGNRITTTSKNAVFSTSPSGYPSFRFTYNDIDSKDQLAVHTVNSKQSYMNAGTDYTIKRLNLLYNYSNYVVDDFVSQIKQETPTHLATVTYSNSFFNNRFNFNMNFGATQSISKNTSLSGESQTFPEEKEAGNGLYETDSLPGDGQLSDYPSLIDDNKVTETGIDLNGSYRNIGLKLKSSNTINTIYLYISTSDANIANMSFGWNAYYSSDLSGNSWTSLSVSSSSYDEVNNRFKIVFSSSIEALYFKVVNTAYDTSAQRINVTEIEAIGSISRQSSVTVESTTDRQYGGFNMNLKTTEKTSVAYNISYNQTKQSLDNRKDTNINHGLSAAYLMSKYASLFLNYQNQNAESTTSENISSNNYSVTLSSNPLETLNGSVAISRYEYILGSTKTSESDTGNINMFFKLYSGIDLGTGITVSKTKDFSKSSDTSTNSFNGNLNLVPRSSINILIDSSFSQSTTSSGGGSSSAKSEILRSVINYTPSRYINLVANHQFLPQTKQNYSLNSRLPGSLQLSLNYNSSETGSETIGGAIYWNISRYIYISSNYSTTLTHNATNDYTNLYSLAISVRK
jgi:hypothetical protein